MQMAAQFAVVLAHSDSSDYSCSACSGVVVVIGQSRFAAVIVGSLVNMPQEVAATITTIYIPNAG